MIDAPAIKPKIEAALLPCNASSGDELSSLYIMDFLEIPIKIGLAKK